MQALQKSASLRADRYVIDDIQPSTIASTINELAGRPQGALLGVHLHTQSDASETVRRLVATDAAASALFSDTVSFVVTVARDQGVIAISEIAGDDIRTLFRTDGDTLAKQAEPTRL